MSTVGQIEKKTQKRVVKLFVDTLKAHDLHERLLGACV
jgi:hypothetical protein